MNPCRDCLKKFIEPPCTNLGHCVYEGTNEGPTMEHIQNVPPLLLKTSYSKQDGANSFLDSS